MAPTTSASPEEFVHPRNFFYFTSYNLNTPTPSIPGHQPLLNMADNSRTPTPKPNPKGINAGHQNFDLSDEQFTSDGNETSWPTNKTRISDKDFLKMITTAYNGRPELVSQWSGQPINFEGEPPKGYALFRLSDLAVHGHPSGKPFRSISKFVDHVHSIMTETLDSCGCALCRPGLH